MPRDRMTLSDGQWEHLGSLIGDFLWDQERFHVLIDEYCDEHSITNEKKIAILIEETCRRVEAGFARPKK